MTGWLIQMKKRKRRTIAFLIAGCVIILGLALFMMIYGKTVYSVSDVLSVLFLGQEGKTVYTIRTLRLPRMLCALLAGASFGLAGNTFQKMLGNPLASPDMIGITSGTSAAAVLSILFFRLTQFWTSVFSVAAGLAVAFLIYMIAGRGGFQGARLILTGIGVQAVLRALISWMLLRAAQYDVGTALRWLNGSLNYVDMGMVPGFAFVFLLAGGGLLFFGRYVEILQLGDPHAVSLGIHADRSRAVIILLSLLLLGFATAVTGPIASVAFLSGPIASRIFDRGGVNMIGSAIVGSMLVMGGDMIGQYAFFARYPVGVVTGILGAPYLLLLLFKINKKGGKLL